MLWIYLALLAYLLNAFSFIIDKHLLSAPIPHPFAYAFWVSVLSAVAVVLIPFGVVMPEWRDLGISFLSGAAFFSALIFFYRSVKHGDVTVTATNTGVFTAVFSYIFSFAVLGERLSPAHFYAFVFMVSGLVFLGFAGRNVLRSTAIAGACFALSFVLLKLAFNNLGFLNGVFWTRVGFVFAAFFPLVSAKARNEINHSFSQAPPKSFIVFVLNKCLVGSGFLLLYYAIRLGDVVVVNALLGVQFVFIFLLTLLTRGRFGGIAAGADRVVTKEKLIGVALVVAGFFTFIVAQ